MLYGYAGKFARINLSSGKITTDKTLRTGGVLSGRQDL